MLLGLTSNLKELIQGLGRIDRIDSQFDEVNYHLVDAPVGRFASDEKIAQRITNYRALSGEELTEVIIDKLETEDTEAILESVISYLRAPRVLRANNFHDLLSRLSKGITPARLADVSKSKVQGTCSSSRLARSTAFSSWSDSCSSFSSTAPSDCVSIAPSTRASSRSSLFTFIAVCFFSANQTLMGGSRHVEIGCVRL